MSKRRALRAAALLAGAYVAPCPFLVIVDHTSAFGPLSGAGHRTTSVRLLGLRWELGTRLSWIS